MKPSSSLALFALFALLGLFASASVAHDAWLEPVQGGVFAVKYGDGKSEPYRLDKTKAFVALDDKGIPMTATRSETADDVRFVVPAEAVLLTLAFDNGFYSKGANGKTVTLPMNETGAKAGSWATKFHKYVVRWTPLVATPVGHRLELVPVSADAPMAGRPMQFRVLLEGKPLANAKVSTGEDIDGPKTNVGGIATFTPVDGRNVVWTGMRRLVSGDPRFDTDNVQVNFRFEAR